MRFKKIVLVTLFIIFCSGVSKSVHSAEAVIEKMPHNEGLFSSINLGLRFSSLLESRGAIFYRDFQIDPVLGLFFFNDRVEFLGDSIGFRDFLAGDWLRLRTRLVSISDDPLFPSKKSVKAAVPNREDTYEWSNRLEFFIPGYNEKYFAEFDIGHAKDISVHKGQYLDFQSKIKLFRFRLPFGNTLIEPNFSSSVGWGNASHNQYFYGLSANKSGINNLSYGLWIAFPEEADRFFPIIQLKHFEVLGRNKSAEFTNNKTQGWLFSFIATYGIF